MANIEAKQNLCLLALMLMLLIFMAAPSCCQEEDRNVDRLCANKPEDSNWDTTDVFAEDYEVRPDSTGPQAKGVESNMLKLVAIAGVCSFLLACSTILTVRRVRMMMRLENYDANMVPRRYRYSELKEMTNSFNDKLGEGGSGSVFKGKLSDGRLVAVKVLNNSKKSNGEELTKEVASLGRTYSVNPVNLLGYCYEGSKAALVYEMQSRDFSL